MTLELQEREEFEHKVFSLLGKQIESVSYLEINYGSSSGWSSSGDTVHSIDLGIEFTAVDGGLYFLTWDHFFDHYHLKIENGSWRQIFQDARQIQVTGEAPWSSFLPATVNEISVCWFDTGYGDPPPFHPRPLTPEQIDITFGDKKISFMTGDIESESVTRGTDNILVACASDFLEKHMPGSFSKPHSVVKKVLQR